MPTNRLTELAIRNAKCGSKRKKLSDGGSMYLELHPNGGKYWRMNYQFQKKEKTLALGVWPQTSLVEARHNFFVCTIILSFPVPPFFYFEIVLFLEG